MATMRAGGVATVAVVPQQLLGVATSPGAVRFNGIALGVAGGLQQQQQRIGDGGGRRTRPQKKGRLVVVVPAVDVDDSATEAEGSPKSEEEQALDSRRGLEERFAVLNTGKHECRSCGHVYDSAKGDENYPVPAGIDFLGLPEDWRCPTCGAAKSYFSSKTVEVAGFAQNQQFGLGGNSLTEGQKSILIYGSLAFFFSLFLAGYLLQ